MEHYVVFVQCGGSLPDDTTEDRATLTVGAYVRAPAQWLTTNGTPGAVLVGRISEARPQLGRSRPRFRTPAREQTHMWIAVFTFAVTVAVACGMAAMLLQSDLTSDNGGRSFLGGLVARRR